MKFLYIVLFFSNLSMAQSLEKFLNLKNDQQKIYFLDHKTQLVEDQTYLNQFSLNAEASLQKLIEVGLDESKVWGDTILEGPYQTVGEPKVELTGIYIRKEQVYALVGRVSSQGIFTEADECIYDEEKYSYSNCPTVTIYQNFIMDINGNLIESDNYPETDF